ncbi:MAG: RlpA-like double-psi beta-barrel domain-containing protein [Coriobacteriia bacterium]
MVARAVLALCLSGALAMPAIAAPSMTETVADRQALERAVEQFEAAQSRAADIDERIARSSAELDRIVALEGASQSRLYARMMVLYRMDEGSYISLLLGASSIQDFVNRLDMLTRMARSDAESLSELRAARAKAGRSSEELIKLQADAARERDERAKKVAYARAELAASQAALREYEERTARAALRAAKSAPVTPDTDVAPVQQPTGGGAWKTAVASHYGRNFTGRGANGQPIGPYSMIVAHKTLPFGTTIEFEYKGRRAVAKVADRGPYTPGRTFDLGPGVVRVLDFSGVHEVRYRIIAR